MPHVYRQRVAWMFVSVAACAPIGCQVALTTPPDAALNQLLKPVSTSPNSVKLEIFEARIPLDQDAASEAVWQEVDEQCFDAELRRRLLSNGLRAGIVGGSLPDELADLLGLTIDPEKDTGQRVVTPESALPRVTRRVVQVNRQAPRTVQTTEVRDEVQVLLSDAGEVRGQTFRKVEGRYELHAEAVAGQRVAVRLTPELHHGELRNRPMGSDQGILLWSASREREAFDDLSMAAELAPGELLLVGCLPDAASTLGGVLHTVAAGGRNERKFVLVRLLEAPESEILAAQN